MDRGTYAAASGGMLQFRKLEVQNNNLANINTVGFKRQYLTNEVQSFDSTFAKLVGAKDPYAEPDHQRVPGTQQIKTRTDFSLGSIQNTGNPFDVALRKANDFLVINTPQGPQYTRAGNLTVSAEGKLITQDGLPVQGDGGEVLIPEPGAVITEDGTIRVRGFQVGRLQTVRFEDPNVLEHVGANRFKPVTGSPAPQTVEPHLVPESLETSNVSAVTSMVDLIVTNRAFEAYTKAAQTIDGMNQTAISQIGRR